MGALDDMVHVQAPSDAPSPGSSVCPRGQKFSPSTITVARPRSGNCGLPTRAKRRRVLRPLGFPIAPAVPRALCLTVAMPASLVMRGQSGWLVDSPAPSSRNVRSQAKLTCPRRIHTAGGRDAAYLPTCCRWNTRAGASFGLESDAPETPSLGKTTGPHRQPKRSGSSRLTRAQPASTVAVFYHFQGGAFEVPSRSYPFSAEEQLTGKVFTEAVSPL